MAEYVPIMTAGREVYERWLIAQDISPDDLWDHLDPHERIGWESLARAEQARSRGLDLSDEEMRALLTTGSSAAWQSATAKLREALSTAPDQPDLRRGEEDG